jgi:hypothetical protein
MKSWNEILEDRKASCLTPPPASLAPWKLVVFEEPISMTKARELVKQNQPFICKGTNLALPLGEEVFPFLRKTVGTRLVPVECGDQVCSLSSLLF